MATDRFRSLRGLTGALVVLLGANVATDLALMWSFISIYRLIARIDAGGFVSIVEADDAVRFGDDAGTASLWAFGIAAVVWLVWEHRAQSNLRALGATPSFTPGWAVGWWFVPFANLVQPYRVMRALRRDSASGLDGSPGLAIVGWWWALWLGGVVAGLIVDSMADGAESIADAKARFLVAIVVSWLSVASAVVALLLVRGIATAQAAPRPLPPLPARPDA